MSVLLPARSKCRSLRPVLLMGASLFALVAAVGAPAALAADAKDQTSGSQTPAVQAAPTQTAPTQTADDSSPLRHAFVHWANRE